ncbi:HAMP domain-containing sensor histidine kinase [uncultured Catenibacterium sp.]|uniref:sensor histidine kinase n=1 Tax=uncultured Catenibacterium sp. TaxID=286142 RepID=UPI0025CC5ED5|nr:HAMP domain-containing sensor histidine kinase [uncultured Catenibacterium sp.]
MKSIYSKLVIGFLLTSLLSFSICCFFTIRSYNRDSDQLALEELAHSSEHIADMIKLIDVKDQDKILSDYSETSEMSFTVTCDGQTKSYGHVNKKLILTDDELKTLATSKEKSLRSEGIISQYAKSFKIDNHVYVVTVQKDFSSTKDIFMKSYTSAAIIFMMTGSIVFLIVADIIVKPISRLTKVTDELAKGNYKVRVNYEGKDEISSLYASFNQMAVRLAKQETLRQQFISDVSHEFQTPLTAISGFATILKNENLTDEQRQKYADIILFNSNRLSHLSKNMLQLTLLDGEDTALDKTEFPLIEQLNRVIEMEDNAALSKDIEIEFIHPKKEFIIEADESRMEQVWINLLSNAIKYTNEHGVVTVEVRRTPTELQVRFEDTGVGMSQDAISHIFERFYRQDKSRTIEGNGLGLSIVKRIIDLHHYKIDVESQEDVGSVFTVYIPYEMFTGLTKKKKD